ncbi:Glu-tRNA(Gln) amidotransferase GatDE subunit E [Candidatus Woesearchaeota archaeon B3_Woes]|nr:MAG: Glu-tRNA(Gln) amidotransferase GatDE subunit E [Candidatus Woesearchaeota archaeon B3_Woes]
MDYQKLGFKCGLEIHQQLEGKKLFCDCHTINSKEKPDVHFERRLRAVVGETGEIDITAKYEMEKSKKFIYEADSKDCCLVEMDEEPPHSINKEAVDVVLQVALMLKAKIVDEIQVMRKTVIDGSNVSGFQRTALVAYGGVVETSKGNVGIPTICLEEEAAQKAEETKEYTKYRLDRLGIPLIEIATDPDIKDNEHAKEVAEKIGMILRSTGKVKRGIGTIRQDVNVSIKGKSRVEMKGFQDLRSILIIIEKEVNRQIKLSKSSPEVRKVNSDGTTNYLRPMPGGARMYPETDVIPLKVSVKDIADAPELIHEKAKRFEKLGLNRDLANYFAKNNADVFEDAVKRFKNLKPSYIASIFTSLKDISKKYNVDFDKLTDKLVLEVLLYVDKGQISKNMIAEVIVDHSKGKFDVKKYKSASKGDLEKEIKKIVEGKPGLSIGAYMGIVMGKYKGKVDGKTVMDILKKLV